MFRDLAVMKGRELYHSLTSEERAQRLREAPYTMSGLSIPQPGKPCQRITISSEARGIAEGLLNEHEDRKQPCGFSRALCWHLHTSPCTR